MAYTTSAIYMQRRVPAVTPPGGDCDPYTRPSPTIVATNLNTAPTYPTPTAVETDLCAPVS